MSLYEKEPSVGTTIGLCLNYFCSQMSNTKVDQTKIIIER
jgi:hypothetical protein